MVGNARSTRRTKTTTATQIFQNPRAPLQRTPDSNAESGSIHYLHFFVDSADRGGSGGGEEGKKDDDVTSVPTPKILSDTAAAGEPQEKAKSSAVFAFDDEDESDQVFFGTTSSIILTMLVTLAIAYGSFRYIRRKRYQRVSSRYRGYGDTEMIPVRTSLSSSPRSNSGFS
ncbi:hypothetical protein ACA910_012473 [Epithemia clementina (nom. ined.)]